MPSRLLILTVLVGLFVLGPCAAQPADRAAPSADSSSDTRPTACSSSTTPRPIALQALSTNTMSVWAGGSFSNGDLIGNIQHARIGLIGLRYERLLLPSSSKTRTEGPTLTYTVDVLPALLLSIPRNTVSAPPEGGALGSDSEAPLYKRGLDTYGVGMSPAGLRLTYRVVKRVQPFMAGSAGIAHFVQSVPNHWGKHLNFMFDVGAGVQVVLTSDLILSVGYRYYHLSNGFRGQINPGIDANLFHFGVAVSQ